MIYFCFIIIGLTFSNQSAENKVMNIESALHELYKGLRNEALKNSKFYKEYMRSVAPLLPKNLSVLDG